MAEEKITLDEEKIKLAIRSGVPLSITSYTIPHSMELYMTDVLTKFLTEIGQKHMVSYLTYCQTELLTNAKKANTKRIYFKEKGLDITNEADYEKGMLTFKEDTLNNINYYLTKQKEAGLYVRFVLQARNNQIKLEVHNNCPLTIFEYRRIHDKLSRAQQFGSIEQAIAQVLDSSEGAGLGLVILILMLEKIGLTEDNFQTISQNEVTITRITLPFSKESMDSIDTISAEFEEHIENLPQFPESIIKLNRLLNDPDSQMSDIAMQISNDVALTGELLKQVNSSAFALANPCSNVADAVKMLGIHGIKNMLFTIGTITAFADKTSANKEKLWAHAYKVALYSYNLASNLYSGKRNIIEDSYICGLLHDMGKIIFENIHPAYLEKIKKLCSELKIETEVLEKVLAGTNHSEIGARVAEKWNFPQTIIDVIRFHHTPENAPENSSKLCYLIYLADLISHYQDGDIDYYQIDENVLSMCNIQTQLQFQVISDKLAAAYETTKDT